MHSYEEVGASCVVVLERPASQQALVLFGQRRLSLAAHYPDKEAHRQQIVIAQLRGVDERAYRYECRQELAKVPGAEDVFSKDTFADKVGIEAEPERVN